MPEHSFRYVPYERAAAWEAAGWTVISGPLELKQQPEREGAARPTRMVTVEWAQAGHPIEPIAIS